MIDVLVGAGYPVKICCRVLGVSRPGYYQCRTRPMAETKMRRLWLTALIREVHHQSRGTYGSRRVHAELTMGRGVFVSERLVAVLMNKAGIQGLPNTPKRHRNTGVATADDLVNRQFNRENPNELWVIDITEHPTPCEGKVYCCCVLDTFSRRIVGWSIDLSQDSGLVVNALDMAIKNRTSFDGGVVHADHGAQTGCWVRTPPLVEIENRTVETPIHFESIRALANSLSNVRWNTFCGWISAFEHLSGNVVPGPTSPLTRTSREAGLRCVP